MSGLYLLGLIGIWLFIGRLIYRFWRNATVIRDLNRYAYYALGGLLFVVWFGGGFWPFAGKKMYYDAQIRDMCSEDGGIEVYEIVHLPKDRFDKYGNINIKSKENSKESEEYYYEIEKIVLNEDDPILIKYTTLVYRRIDNKILGTSIKYGRGGGDIQGFWHPSTYSCPRNVEGDLNLITSIFKKGINK
ncbi:MAG: hypothetical protein KUF72_06570 [Candidatus Thiodiazotropha sp. (ex Ctena orbiculata)]|nr:hypothetical protein [Candidatus Thiodiazotropha taylori]